MSAKIVSGGAFTLVARRTAKMSGLVAAMTNTAATATTSRMTATTAMVMTMNFSSTGAIPNS
jgi:hypothetical protein